MPRIIRGHYTLERQLPTPEGVSEAWLARDPDGYASVVKLWHFGGLEPDQVRRALWDEELRTLYRVASSPGAEQSVVRLREALVDRESRAFVMVLESAGYEVLSDALATPANVPWLGQRSLAQRAALWSGLRRLAAGLRLLHGQHVIHRSVDASNVLVDRVTGVESLRLSGFEWSIRLGSPVGRRAPSRSWATPPELFVQDTGYRPETDWFGLGMLAARMVLNLEDLDGMDPVDRPEQVVRRLQSAGPTQLAGIEIDLIARLVAREPHDRLVHPEDILPAIDHVVRALTSDPSSPLEDSAFFLIVDPNKDWLIDLAGQAGFSVEDASGTATFNPRDPAHVVQLTAFLRARLASAHLLPLDDGGTYALLGEMRPLRIGPYSYKGASSWDMAFAIAPCEVHGGQGGVAGVRLPASSVHVRTVSQAFRDSSMRTAATSWERLMPQDSASMGIGRHMVDFLEFVRLTNQIDLIMRDAEIFPYTLVSHNDDGLFDQITIHEGARKGSPPPRWCQLEGGLDQFLGSELATNKPDCDVVVLTADASLSLGWAARQDRWTISKIGSDGRIELARPAGAGPRPPESGYIRTWGMAAGQIPLIRRRTEAIDRLAEHSYLLQALTAPGRVYMDTGEAELGVTLPEDEVDAPKRAAIEDVLRVRPIYSLQGPPGTGKTTMVAWLLREILTDDPVAQVLITAQAHGAVDVLRQKVSTEVFAGMPDDEKPLAVRLRADERRGEEGSVEAVALEMLRRTAAHLDGGELSDIQREWSEEVRLMIGALETLTPADAAPDFCQVVRRAANLTYCTTSAGDLEVIARDNQSFDWSILEEAGKAHGFDLALPLQAGHRWLLIGDHEQLPPYRYNDYMAAIADLDRTMERLGDTRARAPGLVDIDLVLAWEQKEPDERRRVADYAVSRLATFHQVFRQCGTAPGTAEPTLTLERPIGAAAGMLSGQHRMHPDIGALISEVFYDGRVENRTVETDGHPMDRVRHGFTGPREIVEKAIVWLDLPSAMDDPHFGEVGPDTGAPRYTNPGEASALTRFMHHIEGGDPDAPLTFAALSPYNRQVQLLREFLGDTDLPPGVIPIRDLRGREHRAAASRMSHTVDAFQGNQADIVAVSLVRNNQSPKERGLGFLRDRARINVLLSRAERLLVLVGSWDFFVDQSSLIDLGDKRHDLWHWARVISTLEAWFESGRAVRLDAVGAGLA